MLFAHSRFVLYFLLVSFLVFSSACTKEDDTDNSTPSTPLQTGMLRLSLSYAVDQNNLIYDTIQYQNAAGNAYSVSRLFYYLSSFDVYKTDGSPVHSNQVFYVDAAEPNTEFLLDKIPVGTYSAIQFAIGIDAAQNSHGSLPNTLANMNMLWPTEMGGGYHFLKLEGRYLDSLNKPHGYSVHLGTNMALVNHRQIASSFTVKQNDTTTIHLVMNVNEWFKNPHVFDFNKDGNYTMGLEDLMLKVAQNGKDIFSIK